MQRKAIALTLLLLTVIFVGGCTSLEENNTVAPLNNTQSQPAANEQPPMPPPVQQPAASLAKPAGKEVVIDSYTGNSVTINNVGKETIQTASIVVSVDNVPVTCEWNSLTMPIYTLRQCIFTGAQCRGGMKLTVSGPSNNQTVSC